MKNQFVLCILLLYFFTSNAQLSISSCASPFSRTTGTNGSCFINLKINNPGPTITSGKIKLYWPELSSVDSYPWQVTGTFSNDTVTMTFKINRDGYQVSKFFSEATS